MKFSQRIGKTTVRQTLQIENIDTVLENMLWNNFITDFIDILSSTPSLDFESEKQSICKNIWNDFLKNKVDEIPKTLGVINVDRVIKIIKEWYSNSNWYEKYDFIEFIAKLDKNQPNTFFIEKCNKTLNNELAAYRIIDHHIVPITSEEEIESIELAIKSSTTKSIEIHLKTALEYLSNRENPDYRNSIKESISAVESICIIITGNKKATLGQALNQIEKTHKIHSALSKAFSALYGYTSDSGGIRHSLNENDISPTMEDAKFMLISCSAFINYLKTKI